MGKKEQWAKEAYTVARRFRKQPQQSNLAGAAESSAEILPIQPSLGKSGLFILSSPVAVISD